MATIGETILIPTQTRILTTDKTRTTALDRPVQPTEVDIKAVTPNEAEEKVKVDEVGEQGEASEVVELEL